MKLNSRLLTEGFVWVRTDDFHRDAEGHLSPSPGLGPGGRRIKSNRPDHAHFPFSHSLALQLRGVLQYMELVRLVKQLVQRTVSLVSRRSLGTHVHWKDVPTPAFCNGPVFRERYVNRILRKTVVA